MISGIYFESWDEYKGRLKDLNKVYNTVYLSFANPKGSWNGHDWQGTGMQFHSNMEVVKEDIKTLQGRGVTVMLSVGGASYPFPDGFEATQMVRLANALGCDGIDIDWEGGGNWTYIINSLKQCQQAANGRCMKLSAAVWSTG
jgi:chitinase